jgi:uncharacterized protein YicC (UPF0701 family)
LRSVNGRGLDLRLRVPDWIEGLEPLVRAELTRALHRGSVSLGLRVTRESAAADLRPNPAALSAALEALGQIEAAARGAGVALAPTSAAALLGLRGVLETGAAEEETAALRAALLADLPALIADFAATRRSEGAALARVLAAQMAGAGTGAARRQADVTEELDRLRAHVEAARALLAAAGPVGRKLDFLMQEFNREANTLCSKAQSRR